MREPRSFQSRLAVGMALLATVVLSMCSAAIWWGARQTLRDGMDRALLGVARAEAASAFDAPGDVIHLHGLPPGPGSGDRRMRHLAEVLDGDRVVARSANLAGDLPPPPGPLSQAAFADFSFQGEPYRAVYEPLKDPAGKALVMVVAMSRVPLQEDLQRLLGIILVSLVAALGAAWAGSHALASSLTEPLTRMATAARGIGRESPGTRLPEEPVGRELAALREALNSSLDDLDRALGEQTRLLEAQRRFAADASHELRTPLTNLVGSLEVALRRERSAEECRETMEAALSESRRMARLVEDLLTVSRARSGQLALKKAPVDLAATAREAVKAFGPRARAEEVELLLEAPSPVPVHADADRIRQVLDNLLENAIRHAGPGQQVVVRVEAREGAGRVAVADSGPGLEPEELSRVFERFYRADPSRSRATGGAGLGLAIARTLVQAHGGDLAAESSPGQGATFRFDLPMA